MPFHFLFIYRNSRIKNEQNYVGRTLIWSKCKVMKSHVHRDVNVLSVAECVKLFFWVMVFKKILLNEIDNADYFIPKQNDKATV